MPALCMFVSLDPTDPALERGQAVVLLRGSKCDRGTARESESGVCERVGESASENTPESAETQGKLGVQRPR